MIAYRRCHDDWFQFKLVASSELFPMFSNVLELKSRNEKNTWINETETVFSSAWRTWQTFNDCFLLSLFFFFLFQTSTLSTIGINIREMWTRDMYTPRTRRCRWRCMLIRFLQRRCCRFQQTGKEFFLIHSSTNNSNRSFTICEVVKFLAR